jgi:hypothetical protein
MIFSTKRVNVHDAIQPIVPAKLQHAIPTNVACKIQFQFLRNHYSIRLRGVNSFNFKMASTPTTQIRGSVAAWLSLTGLGRMSGQAGEPGSCARFHCFIRVSLALPQSSQTEPSASAGAL